MFNVRFFIILNNVLRIKTSDESVSRRRINQDVQTYNMVSDTWWEIKINAHSKTS